MNTSPSYLRKSIYSGFAFFLTVLVLSVGYGALNGGLSVSDKVGAGSGLTATSWNRIIDGVLDLDTRMSHFSFSGGNVGIGTANPGVKLDINGTIHSSNLNIDNEMYGDGALQMLATASCVAKSSVGWVAAYPRGSSSTCSARCASTGSAYYKVCQGMISVRGYGENGGVNAVGWWGSAGCPITTYPNDPQFYCCCSY